MDIIVVGVATYFLSFFLKAFEAGPVFDFVGMPGLLESSSFTPQDPFLVVLNFEGTQALMMLFNL